MLPPEIVDALLTLAPEMLVAYREDLINKQYVSTRCSGNGKAEPGSHARGESPEISLHEAGQLGKFHNGLIAAIHLLASKAQEGGIEVDVFAVRLAGNRRRSRPAAGGRCAR